MTWLAILGAGAGCYLLKLAGVSLPARVLDHPVVERVADLIPVALLAALVAVQVFADGTRLTLDARAAGLAAAVVALLLRTPFLVVVFTAAAAAALVRLVVPGW
ncbi:MAG TPA: AzlD domain-containing protein [Nocardioides sp.]|jgi:branched-subunit amino acid transport protein|nr:AzlD domain-containing protein [Nocardioides sp.]